MALEDFFKKREQNSKNSQRTNWGGTGSLPALGDKPAYPSLPATNVAANKPRISEPSPHKVVASNQIIQSNANMKGGKYG